MVAEFQIGARKIGPGHPPLVIAEIGINHGGVLDVAIAMADAAIDAGAEMIKHQTHIVEDEMSDHARLVIPGNADVSIFEIMEQSALSEDDERSLSEHVKNRGCIFISTPFSRAAADRLQRLDVPAYKIGSGECNNYPLIRHIAAFGKPVILSTGMNSIESVRPSVQIFRNAGIPYALLHCTNVYPTPPHLVRLGAMSALRHEFPDAVIGLSDHTTGNYTCLGAVALGASILERHFTDRMDRPGPDIICSMDPDALSDLIKGSRTIFLASGGSKESVAEEASTIAFAFASVVAIRDIKAGEKFSEENLWVKRPGNGDFAAIDFQALIGQVAARSVANGSQLLKQDVLTEPSSR